MSKKNNVKFRSRSAPWSAVDPKLPLEISEAHLEASKLLEQWATSRGSFMVQGWNQNPTSCSSYPVGSFKALYVSSQQGIGSAFPRAIEDSPQRAEWIGDDDYFLREQDCSSSSFARDDGTCMQHVDAVNIPYKRLASTPLTGHICEKGFINKLPDELLREIFRFLPRACDRAVCASVSIRWLILQSHMQRGEFHIKQSQCNGAQCSVINPMNGETNFDDTQAVSNETCDKFYGEETVAVKVLKDDRRVERQPQWAIGDLSRCLEERKATDVRLMATAVGTVARGGLGKLSIRQGSAVGLEKGVTDIGLSAIGFCCSALQHLSLWDCLNIRDEGLCIIGQGCHLLQKVDLLNCPFVGDLGLQSIAQNCPLLSFLSLDECRLIGSKALIAVGEGCSGLLFLNIRNCPLIGDDGLEAVLRNCRNLKRMKLEGLRIGDKSLASIGLNCKVLTCLTLHNLDLITEEGFMSLGKAPGMQSLKRFSVSSCNSFSDDVLATLGNSCHVLKHISLVKCERISDQGLVDFVQTAVSLEVFQIERCNLMTGIGLTALFISMTGKLKEVQIRNCYGIQDVGMFPPVDQSTDLGLKCICLSNCRGVGNTSLALLGSLCRQLINLDLTGFVGLSDEGLLAFLYGAKCLLASLNVSGCVKLTDWAVVAIAEQCGRSLRNFVLDGCKMVTDKGLRAVAKHCVVLEDLDVSACSISDEGVMVLAAEVGQTLRSLNLSGCSGITDKSLPFIEKRCHGLVCLNLKHCWGLTHEVLDSFKSRLWWCDVLSS